MTRSIFAAAEADPKRLALITANESLTYRELADAVRTRASKLSAAGLLEPGRSLALAARATRESLECLLACFAFGVPVLLLHPRLPIGEARDLVRRAGAKWLVDPDSLSGPGPTAAAPEPPTDLDPRSPLVLVPTSGSSGVRKIVVLSREALKASARASAQNLPLGANDRWLLCLPLAHVGGLSIVTRSIEAGSAVLLFDPGQAGLLAASAELAAWLRTQGATLVSLVPSVLDALLEHDPGWLFPSSLRAVLLGGAATSSRLLERARARGAPVLLTYGLTEAGSQVTTTRLGREPGVWQGLVGAGHPLAELEVRIGSDQRIRVRGPTLSRGYLDAESPFDKDGWLVTDDFGALGPDGELFVLGRASERLVSGGENVDPTLVEAILQSLPGVQAACVFGVPDARFGEIVACALVAEPHGFDEQHLESVLAERLAAHEIPRRVARFDSLPLNPSGKVDRARVRALASERLRRWSER